MILINNNGLGMPPGMNIAAIAGLFGTLPAEPMETCVDANIALIGWSTIQQNTLHHPDSNLGYGWLWTIDTMGAGPDGKRHVPVNTVMQEWVMQWAIMTNGGLRTRQKINQDGWSDWVHRWG